MIDDMKKTTREVLERLNDIAATAVTAIIRAKTTSPSEVTPQERTKIAQAMADTVTDGLRTGRACVEILERIELHDLTPEQQFLAADIVELMRANLFESTDSLRRREKDRP